MSKYQLMINEKYMKYEGNEQVEIAKIIDYDTGKDIMFIDYNKQLYSMKGIHTGIFIWENEDEKFPYAIIDDEHRGCLFEKPKIFLTMMLHEYGHYINGDLENEGMTDKIIRDNRTRLIMEGKIQEEERKADEFAISCVGKNTFMCTMDYLISKRRKRGDAGMLLAIKEFELRKKYCKKL